MSEWTTRTLPELTRRFGLEELHTVAFLPRGWKGRGSCVSLLIPECELHIAVAGPDDEPTILVSRPR